MSIVFAVGDALEFDSQFRGFQACLSDFPAGISFMNRKWDGAMGGRDEWIRYWAARARAARNACERGAYGLFWAFDRTTHWTGCALDDAGWEVCQVITHHYGQGMPKSKGALKPASEHWYLVRNGSGGGIQVDSCRVDRGEIRGANTCRFYPGECQGHKNGRYGKTFHGAQNRSDASLPTNLLISHAPECTPAQHLAGCDCGASSVESSNNAEPPACPSCGAARWWACPAAEIDAQSGERTSGLMRAGTQRKVENPLGTFRKWNVDARPLPADTYADTGGASRFFPQFYYAAKSPSRERHAGCHDLYWEKDDDNLFGFRQVTRERYAALPADRRALGNAHATVKSIGSRERPGIARWLVRLITPPGGRVCDVTCGSGSIPIAAHLEGFDAVGMDICPEAITIAQHRAAYWEAEALSEARRKERR